MPPQTTGQPQWVPDNVNTLPRVFDARRVCLNRFQGHLCPSIDTNDFDALAHPIQGQVNPAGISTLLDFLFDHLLPEYPELGSGGFAGSLRLPAALFQDRFCFPDGPIVIGLVVHADFLSEPEFIGVQDRLPTGFAPKFGRPCNILSSFAILNTLGSSHSAIN